MIKIKALANESDEFAKKAKDIVLKYFPKSYVDSFITIIIGDPVFVLKFALGKDQSEWANGIMLNDPLYHQFYMDDINKADQSLKDIIKLEMQQGGYIILDNYDRIKLKWMNKKSKPEQALQYLDKYFKNMKKVYLDNKDKVKDLKDKY